MDSKRCNKTTIDPIPFTDASNSHARRVRRSIDMDITASGSDKRRKFDPVVVVDQLENEITTQCRSGVDMNSPEDVVSSAESGGDRSASSPCFNRDFSLDLKAELRSETEMEAETETSMSSNGGFRRETTETSTSSEICLDSDEMESSSTLKNKPPPPPAATPGLKPPTAADTPTAAEIDEFFSVMEKKEQKRFAEKYNFDIVKDEPMEGRYQWVLLKP